MLIVTLLKDQLWDCSEMVFKSGLQAVLIQELYCALLNRMISFSYPWYPALPMFHSIQYFRSGHKWERRVLLTESQVVFSPGTTVFAHLRWTIAWYKWNILKKAVKPKSKQTKQNENIQYLEREVPFMRKRFPNCMMSGHTRYVRIQFWQNNNNLTNYFSQIFSVGTRRTECMIRPFVWMPSSTGAPITMFTVFMGIACQWWHTSE